MQGRVDTPVSQIRFPMAVVAFVGGRPIETVCENPAAYSAFYKGLRGPISFILTGPLAADKRR